MFSLFFQNALLREPGIAEKFTKEGRVYNLIDIVKHLPLNQTTLCLTDKICQHKTYLLSNSPFTLEITDHPQYTAWALVSRVHNSDSPCHKLTQDLLQHLTQFPHPCPILINFNRQQEARCQLYFPSSYKQLHINSSGVTKHAKKAMGVARG